MKSLLYCLHKKWSLFSALWTYHLCSFETMLIGNTTESFKLWQYHLDLPRKDYVILFPYIVSVWGLLINLKNKHLSI